MKKKLAFILAILLVMAQIPQNVLPTYADESVPDAIETVSSVDAVSIEEEQPLKADATYSFGGNDIYVVSSTDKTCYISGFSGTASGTLVIPNKVGDYKVIGIQSGAFSAKTGFTALVLPDTLEVIKSGAFRDCTGLKGGLTIPDSVTVIESDAFARCTGFDGALKLSKNLEEIQGSAFTECGFKGSLTIPDKVTKINYQAFKGCTGFTGTLSIPGSVQSVGEETFLDCTGFTGLSLSEGLTSLGRYAFRGCSNITGQVTIPNSLTDAKYDAFAKFGKNMTLVLKDGVNLSKYEFEGATGFTGTLTIPGTVKEIPDYAFYECSGFNGLVLKSGITKIGYDSFANCSGFKGTLNIPGTVKEIGEGAFYLDEAFTALKLNNGLETIKTQAFKYCTGLKGNLTLPNTVKTVEGDAFYCPGITGTLTIPASIQEVYGFGLTGVTKVINNSSKKISFSGFAADDKLLKVYFVKTGTMKVLYVYRPYHGGSQYYGKGTYIRNGDRSVKPQIKSISNAKSGITVKWGKISGATKYVLQRNDGSGWKNAATLKGETKVSYTDKKATKNNKKYQYRVRAYNDKYNTLGSDVSIIHTNSPYTLPLPTINKLTNVKTKAMTVKYSKNAKGNGYEIQYSTNKNFKSAKTVKVTKANTVSKKITGLTKGKTYYVRVRSYKTINSKTKAYSQWSATKSVTIAK